jgi:two-component system, cell cycle sensor histidine kinase and response regulator CckA
MGLSEGPDSSGSDAVFYQALFDRNPFPMWVYDIETLRFLAVNAAAVEQYGYSRPEFLEMTLKDIRPPAEVERLLGHVSDLNAGRGEASSWSTDEWRHRRKDGTVFEVEIRATTLPTEWARARLVIAQDVSQQRRLEAQLRHAQKMEAVGRLAGGIAHDFNNLLTVIVGMGDLTLRAMDPDDPVRPRLEQIVRAGEGAAGLTRQLLLFSRKQALDPTVLDLRDLVKATTKMLKHLIGEDIKLVTTVPEDLGFVRADAGQLEQILVNLVVNARDALPQGGLVAITAANIDLDEAYAAAHAGVQAGPYVRLTVADSGLGMSAEILPHVFEPFFTTKDVGRGTGLGLSTVYGIVQQNGGRIAVQSEPARGTTFTIDFPRIASRPPAPDPRGTEVPRSRRGETILVVEDDDDLRNVACEILENLGYKVIEAHSPVLGLARAQALGSPLHLVLTDVVMVGMGGPELVSELVASQPQVKVLYMSGHSEDVVARHGVVPASVAFLPKPFTQASLGVKVREVLDASKG